MPEMVLQNASADVLAGIESDAFTWYGGEGLMYVWLEEGGSLGNGVLYLEHSPDKTNPDLWYFYEFTEAFEPLSVKFSLPHGVFYRVVVRNNQQAVSGLNVKVY